MGDGEPSLMQVQSAIRDRRSHPTVCQNPPAYDPQANGAVERLIDDINLLGHTEIILKGDGEPSLMQVQGAIKEKRSHPTVCQKPQAYDPQSHGAVGRSVQ